MPGRDSRRYRRISQSRADGGSAAGDALAAITASLATGMVIGLKMVGHMVRTRWSVGGLPASRSVSQRSVIRAGSGCRDTFAEQVAGGRRWRRRLYSCQQRVDVRDVDE